MNTIFMNSENSKTSDPHRLLVNLADKIDLRWKDRYILLYEILAFTIHRKKSYKNHKFKISFPTWNEEFELLVRSYFVSDIQDYFE